MIVYVCTVCICSRLNGGEEARACDRACIQVPAVAGSQVRRLYENMTPRERPECLSLNVSRERGIINSFAASCLPTFHSLVSVGSSCMCVRVRVRARARATRRQCCQVYKNFVRQQAVRPKVHFHFPTIILFLFDDYLLTITCAPRKYATIKQ